MRVEKPSLRRVHVAHERRQRQSRLERVEVGLEAEVAQRHAAANARVVEPHLVTGAGPRRQERDPRRAVRELRLLAEPGARHLGRLAEPGQHLVGARPPRPRLEQAGGRERHRLQDAAAPLAVELRPLALA